MRPTLRLLSRPSAAACVLTVALLPIAGCGSKSSTSDANETAASTVSIAEKVGPPDAYSFSPTSVQLSKGSALGIENKTDENHSIACKPDAGVGTTKIAENETKSVMFSTTGTFTCSSTEHPEATLSVTVK